MGVALRIIDVGLIVVLVGVLRRPARAIRRTRESAFAAGYGELNDLVDGWVRDELERVPRRHRRWGRVHRTERLTRFAIRIRRRRRIHQARCKLAEAPPPALPAVEPPRIVDVIPLVDVFIDHLVAAPHAPTAGGAAPVAA